MTCPAGQTAPIRRGKDGDGTAYFGRACTDCPLRVQCTEARDGRSIKVGRYEQRLTDVREQQKDPDWVKEYRATRPEVERKLGHLMRRKHGGRRARMRGTVKIDAENTSRRFTAGHPHRPEGLCASNPQGLPAQNVPLHTSHLAAVDDLRALDLR